MANCPIYKGFFDDLAKQTTRIINTNIVRPMPLNDIVFHDKVVAVCSNPIDFAVWQFHCHVSYVVPPHDEKVIFFLNPSNHSCTDNNDYANVYQFFATPNPICGNENWRQSYFQYNFRGAPIPSVDTVPPHLYSDYHIMKADIRHLLPTVSFNVRTTLLSPPDDWSAVSLALFLFYVQRSTKEVPLITELYRRKIQQFVLSK